MAFAKVSTFPATKASARSLPDALPDAPASFDRRRHGPA